MIAGCSGGRTVGTAPPPALPPSQAAALANAARAFLEIQVPPPADPNATSAARADSAIRHKSYIGPGTRQITLTAKNATDLSTVYQTTVSLTSTACSAMQEGTGYICAINMPVGTYLLYSDLYDATANLLSTNAFANPSPQTIYANNSGHSNFITISTQGVVKSLFFPSPMSCGFAQGGGQVPIRFLDADNALIQGPLANPITISMNGYNGAGTNAVYPVYYSSGSGGYVRLYNNAATINNTAFGAYYQPSIQIAGGVEGSSVVYANSANGLPVYFGSGPGSTPTMSSQGVITTANYLAFAINNNQLSAVGLESTYQTTGPCGIYGSVATDLAYPSDLVAIKDGTSSAPELVVADGQTIKIFDVSGQGGSTYQVNSFPPQQRFVTKSQFTLPPNRVFQKIFGSSIIQGRFDVVSNDNVYNVGHVDLIDTSNGAMTNVGTYSFNLQVPANPIASIAGVGSAAGALYYTNPGTQYLFGIDRSNNGAPYPTLTFTGSPVDGGSIVSTQPSGAGFNYIFVKGFNAAFNGAYLGAFDATQPGLGVYWHGVYGLNSSATGMRYEAGSGQLLVLGASGMYAFNAHQSPYNFANSVGGPAAYSVPGALLVRFVNSTETPGVVGIYGQMYGQPSFLTFLCNHAGNWNFLASTNVPSSLPIALTAAPGSPPGC